MNKYLLTLSLVCIGNLLTAADNIDQSILNYQLVMKAATRYGADVNEIDRLLNLGANPNARLENYAPPLIFATLYEDWACAERLLKDPRTDPNVRDSCNGSPLLYTVESGNYELAKKLIRKGATVDICGGRIRTFLRLLIEETKDTELINMMPDKDKYYRKVLLVAKSKFKKREHYFKYPSWAFGEGVDCDDKMVKDFLDDMSWNKERLLHIAAKKPTTQEEPGLHRFTNEILKMIIDYVQTPGRLNN